MICQVDYHSVLEIRKEVLWPNKNLNYVKMPFDKSTNILHLGIIDNDIINIVSLNFEEQDHDYKSMQICQLATKKKYQGKGYGTIIMNYIICLAKEKNINKIWCNARIEKCGFYQKYGLKKTSKTYVRNGIKIIKMELILN